MDAIWQIEIAITLFFQSLGSWLLLPMKLASFLGQEEFFIAVMPAIYWCWDAGLGLRLGVMLVMTNSLNCWLKMAFGHPRPYWFDRRVTAYGAESSFGMPSNHAQSAMAMWGLLAISLKKRWLSILAAAVIILIGLSRVYLGVHFLDQVLVGWLAGGLMIWLFLRLERPIIRWAQQVPLGRLMLAVLLVSIGIILVSYAFTLGAVPVPAAWVANAEAATPQTLPAPYDVGEMVALAGVWLGLGLGAAWDWRRHGALQTGGSWQKRLVRYILGLVGLLVIYLGLKMVFPAGQDLIGTVLRYLRYGLIGLWVSALAPATFRRLKLV